MNPAGRARGRNDMASYRRGSAGVELVLRGAYRQSSKWRMSRRKSERRSGEGPTLDRSAVPLMWRPDREGPHRYEQARPVIPNEYQTIAASSGDG